MSSAYLLIVWSIVDDVGHQYGQQLCHSVDARRKSPIRSGAAGRLTGLASSFYPLAGYRVYDIEYTQLVGARCLFEMGEDLLDENGFILCRVWLVSCSSSPVIRENGKRSYLNVGSAERGDAVNLGSGYAWWLQGQHGLEIVLQFPYGR